MVCWIRFFGVSIQSSGNQEESYPESKITELNLLNGVLSRVSGSTDNKFNNCFEGFLDRTSTHVYLCSHTPLLFLHETSKVPLCSDLSIESLQDS